ncbi:hypothetical protein [Xanthomonas medicagonis]|uniref:hypothetical protein n=1 Tax=Xanthomonas medicagonis TaxID=3160841 RepID=UPI003514ECC7
MTRRVTIQTPLGEQLQFRQLQGREELSQVFGLDIDLLSEDKGKVEIRGKNGLIELKDVLNVLGKPVNIN